jgi:hypothetical protein
LSLFSIIVVAYDFSVAVSCRPASCAWSSSVARMSTLTMLAVSKAALPYVALSPEVHVEHRHGHLLVAGRSHRLHRLGQQRVVVHRRLRHRFHRRLPAARRRGEADGAAADDTTPECACAFTYTVPPAVTPTTATAARAM